MPEGLALTYNLVLEYYPLPASQNAQGGMRECRKNAIRLFSVLILIVGASFVFVGSAEAQTTGSTTTFFVEQNFDATGRASVTATLRETGTHALIYVEDAYYNSLSASDRAALLAATAALRNEFDAVIYPRLTGFYGTPREPGIDGDARVALLLTKLKSNAGGYFDTSDQFSRQLSPLSNEREMVYINATFYTNPRRFYAFLSHEFTHLIDFNQKHFLRGVDDDVWLNELRAEYAPTYLGYDDPYAGSNLAARAGAYVTDPDDSLTEWRNTNEDYASINMFAQYVAGKYGADVLKYSIQTPQTGIAALDAGLATAGHTVRFADVFLNWTAASFLNSASPGLDYVYDHPSLTGAALRLDTVTTSASLGPSGKLTMTRQVEGGAWQWVRAVPSAGGSDGTRIVLTSSVPLRAKAILQYASGGSVVQPFSAAPGGAELTIANVSSYSAVVVVPVMMGKTSGFSGGEEDGSYPEEPLRNYTVSFTRGVAVAPVVTVVTPGVVVTEGGVEVTVRGSGFSAGPLALTLNGQSVATQVRSDSELVFTAPAHAEGSVCMTIATGSGSVERCDALTYATIRDGDLIRAEGDFRVWIVKGNWRRHIADARVFGFYGHLGFSVVRVVPSETLASYRVSAWVRVPLTADPATWRVYEVNGDASRHWITCANPDFCENTWRMRGGDPDGIFTINQREMDFYSTGAHVFLQ